MGSSPLTRGKRWRAAALICAGGLIPAHAGKTPVHGRAYGSPWAHPRSRGENPTVVGRHLMVDGSSPLTRGKLGPAGSGKSSLGLIPAHAGKTCAYLKYPPIFRAHPRSRGENPKPVAPPEPGWGSSPLTRGKRETFGADAERRGLIPAHAGKTPRHRSGTRRTAAHPRSRGENTLIRADDKNFRAHPRSRGENSPLHLTPSEVQGSSPLTRGKHPHHARDDQRTGLIPAHAGKTLASSVRASWARAHPRSRGENYSRSPRVSAFMGSSPLTRE